MTKDELVGAVAQQAGLTKADARKAVDAVGDAINITVRGGDEVVLPGVGKFYRKQRPARVGRNMRTGETIQVAAKRVPAFKPAKVLADAVA